MVSACEAGRSVQIDWAKDILGVDLVNLLQVKKKVVLISTSGHSLLETFFAVVDCVICFPG
jgi:hypothetical protein